MTHQVAVPDLTEEQMICRLHEAQKEERESLLVRCHDEPELRELFRALHP